MSALISRSTLWLCALVAIFTGCEETLPPRDEPEVYLDGRLEVEPGIVVLNDTASIATGSNGSLIVGIRNIYDEVLQDSALVDVKVDVWWKQDPSRRGQISMKANDLLNYWIIVNKQLTLRLGEEAYLEKQWNHKTNQNIPFWRYVHTTRRVNSMGEQYLESDPVHLIARCSAQLFRTRAPVLIGEREFTLVYYAFGVLDTARVE